MQSQSPLTPAKVGIDSSALNGSETAMMGKSQIKSSNQIPNLIYQIFKSPGQISNQSMGSNLLKAKSNQITIILVKTQQCY
jgi:hypothetical protein